MLDGARVTLKQHRFEVVAAGLAALALGVWALSIEVRLDVLKVPFHCIDNWLAKVDGPEGAGACSGPMHAFAAILGAQGETLFSAMTVLPFAVGLLGGVPIIARELEAGTAQTAWSLSGSRLGWLMRQLTPVAIVLGVAVTFAALAAGAVAGDDVAWGQSAFLHIGVHGPLVVARSFGAFGVGLLVGGLLGRTLPALVLGAVVSLALVAGVGMARDAWVSRLDSVVIGETSAATGELVITPRAVMTGYAWRTREGTQISSDEAMAIVPAEVLAEEDPAQPIYSAEWLNQHGYTSVVLGLTDEMAMGWALYDALIFVLVGVLSVVGAIVLVHQRRPT